MYLAMYSCDLVKGFSALTSSSLSSTASYKMYKTIVGSLAVGGI